MGNIVRLIIILVNISIFFFVKTEQQSDILISYLILFNILSYVLLYFFDFNPLLTRKSSKIIKFEREEKEKQESGLKNKIFSELRFNTIINYSNLLVILFPLLLLLFVKEYHLQTIDVIFICIICSNLFLNIIVLSSMIRNFYATAYILYIIIIGIIFQLYNMFFLLTKNDFCLLGVLLILFSYLTILILGYQIGLKSKNLTIKK